MLAKVLAGVSPGPRAGGGTHRVATYNVLSPRLASPGYFRKCNPKALDPSARLAAVMQQLSHEVESESIVALQEVALSWAGPLQVWFAERGYSFIHSNYGNAFNGYMGVGIAYPLTKYELQGAELCRLSDSKPWPKAPVDCSLPARLAGALRPVRQVLGAPVGLLRRLLLGPRPRPPEDPWAFSQRRFNSLVFLRLRCRSSGASLGVATYHMPCAFFLPPAMVIHCALAAQAAASLAGDAPFVLCGDFNIKPGDATYELLTSSSGTLPPGHPELPPAREWDDWTPTVPTPLASAYATVDGAEPDFTNYAQVRDEPPFIDCLDYIFYSADGRLTPVAVKPLPTREQVGGPLPTFAEPSDHILIAAEFKIAA